MSYPPPPGLKASTTPTPSSLPARPPPSSVPQSTFAAQPLSTRGYGVPGAAAAARFGGHTAFAPRAVAAAQGAHTYRTTSPIVSAGPAPPTGFSAPSTYPGGAAYQPQYQQSAAATAQSFYPQASSYDDPSSASASAPYGQSASQPQIRNPFAPPPGPGAAGRGAAQAYDPELEAQIAQWQSAYAGKDESNSNSTGTPRNGRFSRGEGPSSATGANSGPLGVRPDNTYAGPQMSNTDISTAAAHNTDSGVAAVITTQDGKAKTVIRSGGGQTWQDPSLLEWDPSHFRLFVGNLAGEVTDDSLAKAFSKYASFEKARVVRDKRTTKSKGYGFVSFRDGDDYFQAAREMQGKYIGSHPILLRKSTTEIKAVVPKEDHHNKKGKKGGKGGYGGGGSVAGGGGGSGGAGGMDRTGAGVSKKHGKTKGGLKILG